MIISLGFVIFALVSLLSQASGSRRDGHDLKKKIVSLLAAELVVEIEPKLSNGRYADSLVEEAVEHINQFYDTKGVDKFDQDLQSEHLLQTAMDQYILKREMDMKVLFVQILEKMAQRFVEEAARYNEDPLADEYNPEQLHHHFREMRAKIIAVFFFETSAYGIPIKQPDILTLLEFVYRFCAPGPRYGLAFRALLVNLEGPSFAMAFEIFIKYFKAHRQALPVLFIQSEEDKDTSIAGIFKSFFTSLYNKVLLINQTEARSDFDNHASMVISGMLSCSFSEAFRPMILNLLSMVDYSVLISSPRFTKSIMDYSKKHADSNDTIIQYFASRCFQETFVSAIDTSRYIDFGSLYFELKSHQQSIFNAGMNQIPVDLCVKIESLITEYRKYLDTLGILHVLDTIVALFNDMPEKELDLLTSKLDALIKTFPGFLKYQPQDASGFTEKISTLIPKLFKASLLKSGSPELESLRGFIMLKFSRLCFNESYSSDASFHSFINVLFFLNTKVALRLTADLTEAKIENLDWAVEFIKNVPNKYRRFLKDHKTQMTLYNFLKAAKPQQCDSIFYEIMMDILCSSLNQADMAMSIIETFQKAGLDMHQFFTDYITNELTTFFSQKKDTDTIDSYNRGGIFSTAKILAASNILGKAETAIINQVLNEYTSSVLLSLLGMKK